MRDHLLFAVLPYLTVVAFVAGCVMQLVLWQRSDRNSASATGPGVFRIAWRVALAAIVIGHVLTLGFPRAVLVWDRQLFRLVLLEGARLLAGSIAVAGTIAALARLLAPSRDGTRSAVDVVAATLLLTAMASGVAIAILYRWASSWSEVTLVPYLYSLARVEPIPELVTRLPVLVKLHMVSAFAIIAILPFTGLAHAVMAPLDRFARGAATPVRSVLRPAWVSMERRMGAAVQSVSTLMFHNGEEEN